LGGVAIFIGSVVGLVLIFVRNNYRPIEYRFLGMVVTGMCLAFVIGLWDDLVGIGSKRKLTAQVILGCIAYGLGFRIETISLGPGYEYVLGSMSLPVTVIWISGVMNALNLIDGIDGLAGGISSLSFLAIAGLSAVYGNHIAVCLSLISAAACLGFLRWNFSPAKIFMGDSGSMLLGFLLAVLSMSIVPSDRGLALPIFVPLMILSYPIVDTSVAILRRIVQAVDLEQQKQLSSRSRVILSAMKRVVSADGDHIHHRLIARGFTHRQAALVLYGFSGLGAGMSFVMLALPPPMSWLFAIAVFVAVWHMVLSLDYSEFVSRELRLRHQEAELEAALGSPSLLRQIR
jgi:UDP-GlcNAc:undecaprenyl-phosphate GlcNAc-1-phosphate transferase